VPSIAPQSAPSSLLPAPTDLPVVSPSTPEQSIPTASVVPGGLQWTRITGPVASINGDLGRPTAAADRFYLIDASTNLDGSSKWVLLDSFDGLNWSVVTTVPSGAETVYEAPGRLLAGGVAPGDGTAAAGLWTSQTGSDWTSLTDQPAFNDSLCTRSNFPAISSFWPLNGAIAAAGSGAIWTSADGTTWQCTAGSHS